MSENAGVVLVVDDQPGLVNLYQVMLETRGFSARTAMDGKEALRVFQEEEQIDVVIMDYNLQEESGLDVYRRMLEIDPALKAILCSGELESKLAAQLQPDWKIRLLSKPFNTKELLAAVTGVMRSPE